MKYLLSRKPYWFAAICFVFACIVYSNTLTHDYAWDDSLVITQNKYTTQGLDGLTDIWTKKVFLHNRHVYRPVPQSMFAFEWEFFPANPSIPHFVNVLFYALSCVLLFYFLYYLFSDFSIWLLFFITLLFTLHPVHTEVVANIKSRDEIMALFFGLISLIAVIKVIQKKWKWIFIFVLSFIAAILSKISVVTLLPVFFLLVFYLLPLEIIIDGFSSIFSRMKNGIISFFSFKEIAPNRGWLSFIILLVVVGTYAVLMNNIFMAVAVFLIILFLQFRLSSSQILQICLIILQFFILFSFGQQEALFTYSFLCALFLLKKDKSMYFLLFLFGLSQFLFVNRIDDAIYRVVLGAVIYLVFRKKWGYSLAVITITVIASFIITKEVKFFIVLNFASVLFAIGCVKLESQKKKMKMVGYFFLILILIISNLTIQHNTFASKVSQYIAPEKSVNILQESIEESIKMTKLNNVLVEEHGTKKYATIASIQLKYLQLLVFPYPLVHQYGINQLPLTLFSDWRVVLSIFIHVGLMLFALFFIRKKHPIVFGVLFYLFTISIYTNIIKLMPDTLAERFLFMPSIGFCIAFVFSLHFLLYKIKRNIFIVGGIICFCCMAFTVQTINRNKAWATNTTLALYTIDYVPNNAAINAQYAAELNKEALLSPDIVDDEKNRLIEFHFKRALDIYPLFYSANTDLATFLSRNNRPDDAFPFFEKAISQKPQAWINHYYIGFIYYNRKQDVKGVFHLEQALLLNQGAMTPGENIQAMGVLARAYYNLDRMEEAVAILKKSYSLYGDKQSYVLLANIYRENGEIQKAINVFEDLRHDYPTDNEIFGAIQVLQQYIN